MSGGHSDQENRSLSNQYYAQHGGAIYFNPSAEYSPVPRSDNASGSSSSDGRGRGGYGDNESPGNQSFAYSQQRDPYRQQYFQPHFYSQHDNTVGHASGGGSSGAGGSPYYPSQQQGGHSWSAASAGAKYYGNYGSASPASNHRVAHDRSYRPQVHQGTVYGSSGSRTPTTTSGGNVSSTSANPYSLPSGAATKAAKPGASSTIDTFKKHLMRSTHQQQFVPSSSTGSSGSSGSSSNISSSGSSSSRSSSSSSSSKSGSHITTATAQAVPTFAPTGRSWSSSTGGASSSSNFGRGTSSNAYNRIGAPISTYSRPTSGLFYPPESPQHRPMKGHRTSSASLAAAAGMVLENGLMDTIHTTPYRNIQSFFINEALRVNLMERNKLILQSVDHSSDLAAYVPETVGEFHTLYPMDQYSESGFGRATEAQYMASTHLRASDRIRSKVFHEFTEAYKAIDSTTGNPRLLRRAKIPRSDGLPNNREVLEDIIADITRTWSRIRHPNIITLHKVFLSDQFHAHRSQTLGEVDESPTESNIITPPVGYEDATFDASESKSSSQVPMTEGKSEESGGSDDGSDGGGDGSTEDSQLLENQELFFVYDYIPGAVTLHDKYLMSAARTMSESTLWSVVCQMLSALRKIHSSELTCFGAIDASKMLTVPGKRKVQLNGVGMYDLYIDKHEGTQQESNEEKENRLATNQREDLRSLGIAILSLALKSSDLLKDDDESDIESLLDQMTALSFSQQLIDVVRYMVADDSEDDQLGGEKSVSKLCSRISDRIMDELSHMHEQYDLLESELAKELENGRLFRLLVKIQFVNERLSHEELSGSRGSSSGWSETGDRYILNLFKDYLFNQTTENGVPLVDLGHVIETLNKLDIGLDEKILLMSRDEQNLLVVSFRELKEAISKTFTELLMRYQAGFHSSRR